ncbi:MAG TPA: M48 family metallopeptidase, partial [Anaeromyxobacteraceae bacterium]|nr:M48 family metallopeptidase [Anaeromyxobacteraceae bacterium]
MGTARRRSLIGRALLSLALWAGFWALALGLVAGLAAIPVAQAAYGDGPDGAGLLAGAGAAVVAWGLRPRWGQKPAEARPAPLGRDEFPALHALLADVARRSGAPVPAVVHLASRANAAIWVERRWLGLRRTWVVELGLPLVAALERDELAAVLAHELGHRVGGDLLLGAWVHRTRAAIGSTVDALDGSAFLLDAPFRAYGRLFLAASGAVSREQELAADAHAAALCGPRAAASALRKIEALAAPWDAYFDLDLVPLVEQGARLPLLEGFRRFLAAPARREEVDRALEAAARRPPAPWDSHPALEQRLLAMGAPPPLGASTSGPGSTASPPRRSTRVAPGRT